MIINCAVCNAEMPIERAEYYATCINCTAQGKNTVIMHQCGKTGLHVGAIVKFTDTEGVRRSQLSSNCVIRRKGC